jgi:branched-chain amino acid transport system permease protein
MSARPAHPPMSRRRARNLWLAALAAALAALPLLLRGDYALGLAVAVGINTIVVLGLNLLVGYAGQVSLGQAAFVGLGAYATAVLGTKVGLSPWLGPLAGLCLGALVAAAVGLPLLKLRGHYLAMGTLGFGMIVHTVMVQWESLTGGTSGISGVPGLKLGPLVFDAHHELGMYYLTGLLMLISLVIASNIIDSRVGRAMRAVHGSEVAASTSGVDVSRFKLQVFILSGALAGLAGSLFALHMGYVNPDSFVFSYSVQLLVMVVIGGMASIWGAMFGAAAVTLISEQLRALLEFSPIIFGLVLILLMVFVPSGLWRGGGALLARLTTRGRSADVR